MYQNPAGNGGYRRASHMSVDRAGFRRMEMDDETYKKCLSERRCFSCKEKDRHKDGCPRARSFRLGGTQNGRLRWFDAEEDSANATDAAEDSRDD
jgi:hypothetical protein